jgi:hypothetical protein
MAKKLYDLAVKTGEYQKDGETKGRYENVGAVFANDEGGKFITLKRTFNPAGVPNPDGRDSLILSMFEPRDKDESPRQRSGGSGQRQSGSPPPADDFSDDDIPF